MSKGYIFDFGGTLDTEGCHWGKVLWHAYQRHNIPVGEEQFRKAYVYAEKMLGKNPIIQSDYTFRQTLAAKLRIEFDWLEWSGLVSGNFPIANRFSLTNSICLICRQDLFSEIDYWV